MTTPSGPVENRPPDQSGPPKPGQAAPGGIKIPRWLTWAILIGLIAWNAIFLFFPGGGSSVELPYSDFLTQAKADNVATVTFNGQAVQGTLRQQILWPPASEPGASPAPSAGTGGSATAPPAFYTAFTSVVPPLGDPALLPLLESHNVTIVATDANGGSLILSLVLGVLPVVLLLGFLFYAGRQMRRSQAGIFGFGGSKARLYDPERPKVTFADVAGEDHAKIELAEVVDFLKSGDRYRKLGARLPRGVLLIGPPGTGKTLLARAVAGEAQTPFFSISASEFVELFVGVGASRVRDLFAKAKAAAPAIVFVDEIDAVGRQRGRRPRRRQRRTRADAQPAARRDGRLRRPDQRHRPRRDQPARRPGPGPAAPGPLRPAGHGRLSRPQRARGDPQDPHAQAAAGAGRRPRRDRPRDAGLLRRGPRQSGQRGGPPRGPQEPRGRGSSSSSRRRSTR